jgi:CubicO group peptidase (beta-lactamase class C family)
MHFPSRMTRLCVVLLTATAAVASHKALSGFMEAEANAGRFRGVVLVARDGKPMFHAAYGLANEEWGIRNTTATKFRIGSITKQFTAAAILLLRQRGQLSLSDRLCKYLTNCPTAWADITIAHLLGHTAGLPDVFALSGFADTLAVKTTLDKTIARLQERPLDFAPGTKFNYSNSGYLVLARVVEKVSGKSYAEFMSETIFRPLGMTDSGQDDGATILLHRAAGYGKNPKGEIVNAAPIDMTVAMGAGSAYSTAADLLKWNNALDGGTLLSRESAKEMLASHGPSDFGPDAGYGWFLGKDAQGHQYIGMLGGINGFAAQVTRFPETKLLVIVLSNQNFSRVNDIANRLEAIAMSEK